MANYVEKTRGVIEALSDYWLLYFKDIDQLKALYEGVDILMGQSYLDMLSLLLNNSVQDAPLFNKEYFKYIQIKETDVRFSQRNNSDQSRYVYVPEEPIVSIQALHNKILDVTAALERDVDFWVTEARTVEFRDDPLNAYVARSFGHNLSEFTLRAKNRRTRQLFVWLYDDGTKIPQLESNPAGTHITIHYDGPRFGGTATARMLVSAINTHPEINMLLSASLVFTDGGGASPEGTDTFVPLQKQAVSPYEGFAVRHLEQWFGGKFTAPTVASWVLQRVEKGDILRLLPGPTTGLTREFDIALVRPDALYLSPGAALEGVLPGSGISFTVLREPLDNSVVGEPLHSTAKVVASSENGTLNAAARTLTDPSANFSPVHTDDVVELRGTHNRGYVRILEVLNATTVVLGSTTLTSESPLPWSLHSNVEAATVRADGQLGLDAQGVLRFQCFLPAFTAQIAGTFLKVWRHGRLETFALLTYESPTSVLVQGPLLDAAGTPQAPGQETNLAWGWANYIADASQVAFPHIKEQSTTLAAQRLSDGKGVEEGRDYVVLADKAQIKPLSVWRTEVTPTLNYQYRLQIIAPTQSYTQNTGTLATQNITAFVQEIGLWAVDAQVDRYHLYNTFGYLIQRFSASSEAYRALIRGTFQLFMLGPTLERFESAVNTVAGLPVIRDEGEILIGYDRGAQQSGQDGYLSVETQLFTAQSANFLSVTTADFIYIANGLQENKLYRILEVLSPTEVRLENVLTTDGPLTWELTTRGTQVVTTSKRSYSFARTVPLRESVTRPENIGTKIFRAFEVLTDVFEVTDYLESPTWWDRVQIPEELWTGQSPSRRQSTPTLVENVIGPFDEAAIGDPGFLIGADSTGFIPDASQGIVPLRHKAAFVVLDTWLKHHLFYVSFNPVLLGILSTDLIRDLEALVFVAKPAYTYLILSPTSFFKELIRVEETMSLSARYQFGGPTGEEIQLHANEPLRIGENWQIGYWYRYLKAQGTLDSSAQPGGSQTLWSADSPNARARFTEIWFQGLSSQGQPIPMTSWVEKPATPAFTARLENNTLIAASAQFHDTHLQETVRVMGSTHGQDGAYVIGQIISPTRARLAIDTLTDEANVTCVVVSRGSSQGRLISGGLFVDETQTRTFGASDVGTFIRFLRADGSPNQVVEITGVWSSAPHQCAVKAPSVIQEKVGSWEQLQDLIYVDGNQVRFSAACPLRDAGTVTYYAQGFREPVQAQKSDYHPELGDTRYAIGGLRHVPLGRMRTRSGRDVDFIEAPIQITRRNLS